MPSPLTFIPVPEHSAGRAFHEEQVLLRTCWWIWVLVAPPIVLAWYGFVQQIIFNRPFGDNPGPDWFMWVLVLLFGIGFPVLLGSVKLSVRITREGIQVVYFPFLRRLIRYEEIEGLEVSSYRFFWDYGGWGIRWSSQLGLAYTVSGNRGVRLFLKNGKRLLIGTQRPEELAVAISAGTGVRR